MWKPKRIQHAGVAFVQHSKCKNAVGRQKLNTLTTMIFSSLHCGNILITQSAVFIFIYSSPEYFGKTWLKCKQNILAILLMYIISIKKKTKTEQSYNVIARTTFHIYCKEPKYCDKPYFHVPPQSPFFWFSIQQQRIHVFKFQFIIVILYILDNSKMGQMAHKNKPICS